MVVKQVERGKFCLNLKHNKVLPTECTERDRKFIVIVTEPDIRTVAVLSVIKKLYYNVFSYSRTIAVFKFK